MKIDERFLKNTFFSILLTTSVALTAFTGPAEAAKSCRVTVTGQRAVLVELQKIKGSDKLVLKGATLTKVKALFEQNGVDLTTKKITEALVAISEHIRNGSDEPSLVKSEKLAKFVNKFYELTEGDFSKDQKLMLGYLVGESVLKMERLPLKKFKKNSAPDVFTKEGVLHIKEFHKYVESYIDGTLLYKNLSDEVGFLEWPDIRHFYSNNSYAIGLRDHDMYHLHYAYGPPYYMAINFMTARGINDRRYAMISAYWEAVDTNQTGFESKMSRYFRDKNMTPQEGMIYLARATNKILDDVEGLGSENTNSYYDQSAVDVASSYNIGVNSGWQARLLKFGRTTAPDDLAIYDKELENFINKSLEKRANTANKRYYNYHRKGPGKTSATDEDRSY